MKTNPLPFNHQHFSNSFKGKIREKGKIRTEYGKIQNRKISVFGHFSHGIICSLTTRHCPTKSYFHKAWYLDFLEFT